MFDLHRNVVQVNGRFYLKAYGKYFLIDDARLRSVRILRVSLYVLLGVYIAVTSLMAFDFELSVAICFFITTAYHVILLMVLGMNLNEAEGGRK